MNDTQATPEFICGPEVARRFGISYAHLRNLLRKGEGPPSIMLGRRRLFKRTALDAFISERVAR